LLEFGQTLAEIVVLEVAASLRILIFPVRIFLEVYSLKVFEIDVVDIRVGFLQFVGSSLVIFIRRVPVTGATRLMARF
jgi:hypothetical protein